jgi:hypothetical protein
MFKYHTPENINPKDVPFIVEQPVKDFKYMLVRLDSQYAKEAKRIKDKIDFSVRRIDILSNYNLPVNFFLIKKHYNRIASLEDRLKWVDGMRKFVNDTMNGNCGKDVKRLEKEYNSHCEYIRHLENEMYGLYRYLERRIEEAEAELV